LNRPPPDELLDVPSIVFLMLELNTEPRLFDELLTAEKKLKSGKAPGEDHITAGLMKTSISSCISILLFLFQKI